MTFEEDAAQAAADAAAAMDDGDLERLGIVLMMRREYPRACESLLQYLSERALKLGCSAGDVFNFFMEDTRVETVLSILEHAVTEERRKRIRGAS